ncbi:MAG: hypothetical protein MUC63_00695 [Planctomycetes bacterium]|jgi:hypothetical protein|nr:hypothetical protein [Planctomycetota bacterium]
MNPTPTEASLWRIEFARELSRAHAARPGCAFVVLGGSPSRGLSDAYSDLDIVVYWAEADEAWLESAPAEARGGKRVAYRKMDPEGVWYESYYFGTLKADFGHVTTAKWAKEVDRALVAFDPDPELQKELGGFLDSVVLFGQEKAAPWKARVASYPPELAKRAVKAHMRFLQPGSLEHQGLDRGDVLYAYDGALMVLKNLLGILAGLNRSYFGSMEPRWMEFELSRWAIKPDRAWERMRSVVGGDLRAGLATLDALVLEVLDLVGRHMPELDPSRLRRLLANRLEPCEAPPPLIKPPSGN